MRSTAVAALAVAGLAATFASTPARADAAGTNGLLCQFATVVDPTAEAGTQSGQLSGGPVVLTEQDGVTPETGTLTCRVQVGTADHTGSGPAVSGQGTGLFTAGPALITISVTDDVYLCSEFTDDSDGLTYYWDDDRDEWSTDATTACSPSTPGGGVSASMCVTFPLDCPPYGPGLLPLVKWFVDSLVCPTLKNVFPPDGDVVLPVAGRVWDCPPYGN